MTKPYYDAADHLLYHSKLQQKKSCKDNFLNHPVKKKKNFTEISKNQLNRTVKLCDNTDLTEKLCLRTIRLKNW